MDHIALQLRAMQFLAHRAHNEVNGPSFFADHEFLGELYPVYEKSYDDVVERIIGLSREKIDIAQMNVDAAKMACVKPNETGCDAMLKVLLKAEQDLCTLVAKNMEDATDGTQNLIQGIADMSESRQFLMKKRLAII